MRTSKSNISAILAGEQRCARFRCRHCVAAAAKEVGFPTSWVWFWLLDKRLKYQTWLRKIWVRLEDVQEISAEPQALRDAFYATGDFLELQGVIRRLGEGFPHDHHPYVKFQLPPRKGHSRLSLTPFAARRKNRRYWHDGPTHCQTSSPRTPAP
jgi:hypothetical protein